MNDSPPHEHDAQAAGHESLAISVRAVVAWTIGLVLLVAITLAAIGGFSAILSGGDGQDVSAATSPRTPEALRTVGLDPNQAEQLRSLTTQQRQWLNEYAWTDQQQQYARIPIDRAMDILTQQRMLLRPPAPVTAPTESLNETPQSE